MKINTPLTSILLKSVLCAVTLSFSAFSTAELVAVPNSDNVMVKQSAIAVPARSVTKAHVESKFGEPLSKTGPVGDPAIYSWRYSQFTVYFENDRVLHSVAFNG